MSIHRLTIAGFSALLLFCCTAQGATVGFLGVLDSGRPGPVLGSLPRNFVLTLDYTPTTSSSGTTVNAANLYFPATPNLNTTNPSSHPLVAVTPTGGLTVANNMMGTDFLEFNGSVSGLTTGPTFITFRFSNPIDTIDTFGVTEESVAALVTGQTMVAFQGGGGFIATGSIQGAPEPSTMLALSGMVLAGCGVGYRRRLKKKQSADEAEESEAV